MFAGELEVVLQAIGAASRMRTTEQIYSAIESVSNRVDQIVLKIAVARYHTSQVAVMSYSINKERSELFNALDGFRNCIIMLEEDKNETIEKRGFFGIGNYVTEKHSSLDIVKINSL